MDISYNVMTGMQFHFDASTYKHHDVNRLPWKEGLLQRTLREHKEAAARPGHLGIAVKKKGLTTWELNKKTGELREADTRIRHIGKGRTRIEIIKRKDCDYYQALNEETAKAKARKLFLHKY